MSDPAPSTAPPTAPPTAPRITLRGLELPKPCAHEARVRRELTVAPFDLSDPFPKKFRVFLESPTRLVVPLHWARAAGLCGDPRPADARPEGASWPPGPRFRGTLRPGQVRAAEDVEAAWAGGGGEGVGEGGGGEGGGGLGGAMLCLPCGFGKTSVALFLACRLRRKTVVVVHTTVLRDQWKERVAQFVPGARVSVVQGPTCDLSGDVVIAMIQTLAARRFPASTFRDVGLVVVDEAHRVAAPVLSSAMWGLCARRTLGLTATPDRKDGLARVVEWFLGPIAHRVRRTDEASTEVRVARHDCPEFRRPPPVNRRGDLCFATLLTELCANEGRTAWIADLAADLALHEARDVLVLSHRRAHCRDLATAIRARGVDAASYVGGDKTVPDARVIASTFSLVSEGFDLPRLNALVLATPASSVEQACGRVMRGASDLAPRAIVVDVLDAWGPCHAQHASRRRLYAQSGFTMRGPVGPVGSGDAGDAADAGDADPSAEPEKRACVFGAVRSAGG